MSSDHSGTVLTLRLRDGRKVQVPLSLVAASESEFLSTAAEADAKDDMSPGFVALPSWEPDLVVLCIEFLLLWHRPLSSSSSSSSSSSEQQPGEKRKRAEEGKDALAPSPAKRRRLQVPVAPLVSTRMVHVLESRAVSEWFNRVVHTTLGGKMSRLVAWSTVAAALDLRPLVEMLACKMAQAMLLLRLDTQAAASLWSDQTSMPREVEHVQPALDTFCL